MLSQFEERLERLGRLRCPLAIRVTSVKSVADPDLLLRTHHAFHPSEILSTFSFSILCTSRTPLLSGRARGYTHPSSMYILSLVPTFILTHIRPHLHTHLDTHLYSKLKKNILYNLAYTLAHLHSQNLAYTQFHAHSFNGAGVLQQYLQNEYFL
jgi:hypothetical protein